MTQEDKWNKNHKKYYRKKVRVYENNGWYDGYISDKEDFLYALETLIQHLNSWKL